MRRLRPLALAMLLPLLGAGLVLAQGLEGMRAVVSARYPAVHWVDVPTLEGWLREAPPPLLLDARTPEEFATSHLRGAVRVDPDAPDVAALPGPEGRRVVVYCSVGYRSGHVADALQRAGWREVYNLEGGIFAWANGGRTVVRGDAPVREVHPYDAVWGRMLDAALHPAR